MNKNSFKKLPLQKDIIDTLEGLGYSYMTDIQDQALPFILEKRDVIAKAKTGSGKTISFLLGVINNLDVKNFNIQALILCPTRELAFQVSAELKKLLKKIENIKVLNLTGGVPYKPQVHSLSHKAHIIVATPGRVLKHLEDENLKTNLINTLVLDEADRMLDMGFYDDIIKIISFLPKVRHNMFFSATYPENIESLASKITENAIYLEAEEIAEKKRIEQIFYDTEDQDKYELTTKLFDKSYKSVIIFCNTKVQCDELADFLEDNYKIEPLVLHSDLLQQNRDEVLTLFSNKSYPLLIATDLASRGIDIKDIDLVINFDMPEDLEVYVHRIGRTARAGKSGKAVNFCKKDYLKELESFLGERFELKDAKELQSKTFEGLQYDYSTVYISGGKKDKLRAGDILGALTAGIGCKKEEIGSIDIFPKCSYVAVKNEAYRKAYNGLKSTKIKNKDFRVYER